MDREWVNVDRLSKEYKKGVEEFCVHAVKNAKNPMFIKCPCKKCLNIKEVSGEMILREHLMCYGIDKTYKVWIYHGEIKDKCSSSGKHKHSSSSQSDIPFEFRDMKNTTGDGGNDKSSPVNVISSVDNEELRDHPNMCDSLRGDAGLPLWPGCTKASKLSAVLTLYNLKARDQVSDVFFTELLEAVSELLPDGNVLPRKAYDAKQLLKRIGLTHEKIHACTNDCILFRKENSDLNKCPKCGMKRYKKNKSPAKVMWYFPIIPRFRRLYSSAEDAQNLTWHHDDRVKDGMLRHPADSPQWKTLDNKYLEFRKEPRNLRLVSSTDGMNPHGLQSSSHSTWPVVLMIYNLAPSLCMKRKYMMLSILISGPRQPGNDIDVYLAPLIEDLQLLWEEGIDVYDGYRKNSFRLKAMWFGTINDFPAYGNLSGYSVKGHGACPWCTDNTDHLHLSHCKKSVYMGHRRWLNSSHPYRKKSKAFNGKVEDRFAPPTLLGVDVLKKVEGIETQFGKKFVKSIPTRGFARIQFDVAVESERHSYVPQRSDEVRTVGDAVGHFISWPKKLVSLRIEGPPSKKQKMDKMSQHVPTSAKKPILNSVESKLSTKRVGYPKSGDSIHDSMVLHILSFLPQHIVTNGIEVPMTKYFGGEPWSELIVEEHITEILKEQWLSATTIAFYARYLGEVYLSENDELSDKFSFVSPHIASMLGSGTSSNYLAQCLLKYKGKDHLLLIPHNVGHHWVLVAINTLRETIYFMDPAPNAKFSQRNVLKDLVESGMRSYRTLRGGNLSKVAYNRFNWTNIQCPKQNDSIHCGYYVCCYMEDILNSGDTSIPLYFVHKQPLKFYPQQKWRLFGLIGQDTSTIDF